MGRVSAVESDLFDWVSSIAPDAVQSARGYIPRLELDIVCPSRRVAIEFNGLYWHSDANKPNSYHREKTDLCREAGLQLVHIWEDDWNDRRDVVKGMIARKLGVSSEPRLNARSLKRVAVSTGSARIFLERHHVQGFASGTAYYGLQSGSELVALLVMKRRKAGEWELVRYATSAIVRGGHSKLFKWFLEDREDASRVVTFADRGVSDGGLYETCGFKKDGELPPDYMYVVKGRRVHKFNYRKARFQSDPNLKFDETLTEKQLASLNGLPRIYDAGKIRYVFER